MAEVFGLDTYEYTDSFILRNTAQLTNGDTTAKIVYNGENVIIFLNKSESSEYMKDADFL